MNKYNIAIHQNSCYDSKKLTQIAIVTTVLTLMLSLTLCKTNKNQDFLYDKLDTDNIISIASTLGN